MVTFLNVLAVASALVGAAVLVWFFLGPWE